MNNNPLTLSIIIPVYNEEDYIGACLDSIAVQTHQPLEVIVVDNNCTDKTIEIAKQYSFVKILTENRQHQSFAQATGFNAAHGDILGRIDADSILPPDWTQKVIAEFENNKMLLAVTGGADPYDVLSKFLSVAGFNYYIFLAGKIAGVKLLWGSNCALRATAWQQIKDKVMLRPGIWEDYDMSFCLKPYGQVSFMEDNKVRVSFRALGTSYKNHISYQFQAVRTFYYRTNILRTLLFFCQWLGILVFYPFTFIDVWVVERKLAKISE